MKGTSTSTLFSILIFLAVLGFISTLTPPDFKIMNPFDFAWFTTGIIGVSSACVIFSGVPCAGALAVWGLLTVLQYLILTADWLKLLIFTPLSAIIIYIVAKLGRGGG